MLTTIEGLLERERGSKCDGFAVTFTTIDVPAALALASAAGKERRCARERMARKREKKSGSKCGGETATFTTIEEAKGRE